MAVVVFITGFVVIFSYYERFACLLEIKFSKDSTGAKDRIEFVSRLALLWTGLLGIVLATWRNIVSQSQVDVAHRSQVSDQWTRAMDLLTRVDSKNKPLMEARIGGLNSLEFLANADPEGYGVHIMKSIVTYIRENAQKTAQKTADYMPKKTSNLFMDEQLPRPLGGDVRLAFIILKRVYDNYARTHKQREKIKLVRFFDDSDYTPRLSFFGARKSVRDDLDFSHADFHELNFNGVEWIDRPFCVRINFQKANLREANFAGAHLEGALLQGTQAYNMDMRGASLWGAQLQKAFLFEARLQGVNLGGAKLLGAYLDDAQLQGANLGESHLQGANLRGARLQGANLRGARLQGAYLYEAQLQGANLYQAELNFNVWHKVQFDVDRKSLEISLKDAKLRKDKVKNILQTFDNKRGSRGLWQPKSAQIICDEESFAPLQKYGHSNTERLTPNDNSVDWWQEGWENILGGIGRSNLPYAIRGFIDIHGYDVTGEEIINRCIRGLRLAIDVLIEKHPAIEEKLSKGYRDWLKPPKKS